MQLQVVIQAHSTYLTAPPLMLLHGRSRGFPPAKSYNVPMSIHASNQRLDSILWLVVRTWHTAQASCQCHEVQSLARHA